MRMHRSATIAALVLAAAGCGLSDAIDNAEEKAAKTEAQIQDIPNGIENRLAAAYPEGLDMSFLETDFDASLDTQVQSLSIDYEKEAASAAQQVQAQAAKLRLQDMPPPNGAGAPPPKDAPNVPGTPPPNGEPTAPGAPGEPAGGQCSETLDDAFATRFANQQTAARQKLEAAKASSKQRVEAKARLNGTAECAGGDLLRALRTMQTASAEESGNLDGFGDCYMPDYGIVKGKDETSGEVCLVSYTRDQLDRIGAYVDFALSVTQAMLCQAKKDGQSETVLADGETRDLAAALAKTLESPEAKGITVKGASIGKTATAYKTQLSITVPSKTPGGEAANAVTITIDHRPTKATNDAYSGVIGIAQDRVEQGQPKRRALSLSYLRADDPNGTRFTYELRSGLFKADLAALGADGLVDFNVGADASGNFTGDANAFVSRMNLVSYDGYPDHGVGRLAYWVNFGGSYNETARGFVFDVKKEAGVVKGCGIAGASSLAAAPGAGGGFSIRRAIKENLALEPVGYWRPFLCDSTGAKVWKQCFTRDAAGKFQLDAGVVDQAAGFDFVDVGGVGKSFAPPPPPGKKPGELPSVKAKTGG